MKKPSIFSKNYEKAMKKRRRIKFICIIFSIFIVATSIFLYFNYDYIHNNILRGKIKTEENVKNLSQNKEEKINKNKDQLKKEEKKEEKILLKLKDDLEIEAKVDNQDKDKRKFKELALNDNIDYELNGDSNMALVFAKKSNEMFLVNIKGEVQDISYKFFVSKNGNKIERNSKLKVEPDFVWTINPKLYDNKVFYLSKLPNLNNHNRYFVWIYDIENKNYTCIYNKNLRSKHMEIGQVTEKGLEIKMDGSVKYVNKEGKINN